MVFPALLAPIIAGIAGKGLDLVSNAIQSGGDKAVKFIEEKTGLDLSSQDAARNLSAESLIKLHELQATEREALARFAYLSDQLDSNERIQASEERIEWLRSDDEYTRQTRPLLLRIFAYASVTFVFITPPCLALLAAYAGLEASVIEALLELIKWLGGFLFGTFTMGWTGYIKSRKEEKLAHEGIAPPLSAMGIVANTLLKKKSPVKQWP